MRYWLGILGVVLGISACSSKESEPPSSTPFDHTKVFEVFEREAVYRDTEFGLETPRHFFAESSLSGGAVRALAVFDGRVYVGASSGLYHASAGALSLEPVEAAGVNAVVDLQTSGARLYVAAPDRVVVLGAGGAVESELRAGTSSAAITAVAVRGDLVIAGTSRGLFQLDATTTATLASGFAVRDVAVIGDVIYAATDAGVVRYDASAGQLLSPWRAPTVLVDDDVRAVSVGDGVLLAACATGLSRVTSEGTATHVRPGRGSLPNADLTAVFERDGVQFTGHAIGATAIEGERIDHYHSLRWILDQRVSAVAIDDDGARWIGTAGGVTRISFEPSSLAEKAELNEGLLQARHWRMDGFVDDDIHVGDPWTLEPIRTGDHDNDGLWTEMQIGAWCYAYAVTKEQRFYEAARKAMDVMFLQIDVPAVTFEAAGMKRGFITRSLVRDDEGEVFTSKSTRPNWHLQSYEGRDYYWKDDTSSDEYAGHYFGIPIFYDLCAQSEVERDEIRARIRLTTDYLIDNGYVLIDLDGQSTLHGHWEQLGVAADGLDPCVEKLGIEEAATCISSRHGGGWLNSTEILGHLLAAWHITGDPKYYDEYDRLAEDERYADMVKIIDDTFTVTRPRFANHSDHELGMLAYITLLRYEPNLDRRAQYVQSLLDFYEFEREEHNPWQVAVIGAYHPGDVDLAGAVQTLKDMPLDWRQWRVDNEHRQDAMRWPLDRHDRPQFDRVFPYDEIRTMKWNGSPYAVTGGGDGRGVLAPTPYLLAYWMARYYGLIAP